MKHALSNLEAKLRADNAPRPPNLHGTRLNQFRRSVELESWHRHQAGHTADVALSQEERDRRAFKKFYGWIVASKAEGAAADRVAKAQATLQHKQRSREAVFNFLRSK